ncbi:Ku protein [Amorphoplanes nipponensis]|uniref:Non-homologous end joining protein Ku n=1 Tax=Actinoplanes nipponensis TaxID=135950 RepID=A0A919JM32_9ACTN|nr:Ku protein [Actinoplanes nipponensis]GIE51887.1 non-homologous end joining protein Ku [Actinoplanes nipponensis]
MRAIWKGAVSFGLVSIAVKLFSATEEKDIRFHQVHRTDGGRIKYKRTCSIDGEEVTYDDIAKGYDLGGGEMVILTDEDFAELPLTTSRAIDVLEFVPAEQIDPLLFAKAYYLEPEGQAAKPYVLLRDALTESDRVAIVKVALRQREQLATLRVHDDVLVLNTMLWPDEVRTPDFGFLDEDIETRPAELAMASSLIDSMAGSFKPEEFTDNYRAALQEVIDAKVEGREIVAPEEAEEAPAAAVDLMAALKASVERAKKARGEAPEERAREIGATPIGSAKSKTSSGTATKSTTAKKAAPAKTSAAAKSTPAAKATAAPSKSTAAKKAPAKKTTPAAKAAKKSA